MSLNVISIRHADDIIELYTNLLAKCVHSQLRLSHLQGYDIKDIANAFLVEVAYLVYKGKRTPDELREYAKHADAGVMHFGLAFHNELYERCKASGNALPDAMILADERMEEHEQTQSFLKYCLTLGRENPEYWEKAYGRIGIVYDTGDPLLENYFGAGDKAKRLAKLNGWIHYNAGLENWRRKNYEDAYGNFNEGLEYDVSNAALWSAKGRIESFWKKDDAAIRSFNRAILLDAGYADAYYDRGLIQLAHDRDAEGISDLKKAKELGLEQASEALRRLGYK